MQFLLLNRLQLLFILVCIVCEASDDSLGAVTSFFLYVFVFLLHKGSRI